jgi:hypothetical protein
MSVNYKYQGIALTNIGAINKPAAQGTINTDLSFTTLATLVQGAYNFNSNAYVVPSQYAYLSTGNIGYSYKGNPIQILATFQEYTAVAAYNLTTTGYNKISGIIYGGGGGGSGGSGGIYQGHGGAIGGVGGIGASCLFSDIQVAGLSKITITVGNGGGGGGGGSFNAPSGNADGGEAGNEGNATQINLTNFNIVAAGGNGGTALGPTNSGTGADTASHAGSTKTGTSANQYTGTAISIQGYGGRGGGGSAGGTSQKSSYGNPGGQGNGGGTGYALIFLQKN